MKIKLDKKDRIFSELVRERAGWECEVCGNYFPEGNRRGLECSHFYSRRYRGLRFHPLNAAAHCTGCHAKLGGNPIDFAAWIEGHIGKAAAGNLRIMSTAITKLSKPAWEDVYKNMKAELVRMRQLRKGGQTGRIEFLNPYPEKSN